jgi:hypothetical protein
LYICEEDWKDFSQTKWLITGFILKWPTNASGAQWILLKCSKFYPEMFQQVWAGQWILLKCSKFNPEMFQQVCAGQWILLECSKFYPEMFQQVWAG